MHILWLVMGFIGAIWIFWDSYRQGYTIQSSIRWAIGTFLVPAAVIPFYLLQSNIKNKYKSKRSYNTNAPEDVTASMRVKCSTCNTFFQGNPSHCPHCGTNLKE